MSCDRAHAPFLVGVGDLIHDASTGRGYRYTSAGWGNDPHIADALALKAAVDNEPEQGADPKCWTAEFVHDDIFARLRAIKAPQ